MFWELTKSSSDYIVSQYIVRRFYFVGQLNIVRITTHIFRENTTWKSLQCPLLYDGTGTSSILCKTLKVCFEFFFWTTSSRSADVSKVTTGFPKFSRVEVSPLTKNDSSFFLANLRKVTFIVIYYFVCIGSTSGWYFFAYLNSCLSESRYLKHVLISKE